MREMTHNAESAARSELARPLVVLAFVVALLFANQALAGCSKDTDCKGERICQHGICVAPEGAPAPIMAPRAGEVATPEQTPPRRPSRGTQPPTPSPPLTDADGEPRDAEDDLERQTERCRPGQRVTADSAGHCCWPAQSWSDDNNACVGAPRCPRGFLADGAQCISRKASGAVQETRRNNGPLFAAGIAIAVVGGILSIVGPFLTELASYELASPNNPHLNQPYQTCDGNDDSMGPADSTHIATTGPSNDCRNWRNTKYAGIGMTVGGVIALGAGVTMAVLGGRRVALDTLPTLSATGSSMRLSWGFRF